MARFPDTVFRVAGILPISDGDLGIAIPIFESLENEGRFFTQKVVHGGIARFEKFSTEEFAFDFFSVSKNQAHLKKIGEPALYAFLVTDNLLIGTAAELRAPLEQLIASHDLSGEEMTEAAFLLQDEDLLRSCLDKLFTQIRKSSPASAEFFRVNNILRMFVANSLANVRLEAVLRNTRIEVDARGNCLSLAFPKDARQEEAAAIKGVVSSQMRLSSAFDNLTANVLTEIPGTSSAMTLPDFFEYVQFDLAYSPSALQQNSGREIFIPQMTSPDAFARLSDKIAPGFFSQPITRPDLASPPMKTFDIFVDRVIQKAAALNQEADIFDAIEALRGRKAVNLHQARTVAALVMFVAYDAGVARWWDWGGIHCCLYSIKWDSIGSRGDFERAPGSEWTRDLFCINVVRDLYFGSQQELTIPIYLFVSVPQNGAVHAVNFAVSDFKADNEYIGVAMRVMHGL